MNINNLLKNRSIQRADCRGICIIIPLPAKTKFCVFWICEFRVMISEDLSMRDHAFSSAPPSVTRLRVSGFAKSLAHTHPYFISVRHTCIYPLFLLAVLFVLHGKRQMTPIIHALTFFPHNTVSLRLVSCSWIERGFKWRNPCNVS